MAAKKKDNVLYMVKADRPYLLLADGELVGGAGSRVTAADTAKALGYDGVKEVTLEQWLRLISSSE